MVEALSSAVAAAAAAECRALVLRHTPPVFCAGGSLDDLLHPRAPLKRMYDAFRALDRVGAPSIAVVDGAAVGAGINLLLACDVVLCSPESRFDVRFLQAGLHPGGGFLWRLRRVLGPQAAAAMTLFGEVVTGEEAARIGLVWRCVRRDELLAEATALARRAAGRDPELVQRVKATLAEVEGVDDPEEAMALEAVAQRWSMDRPQFTESLRQLRANGSDGAITARNPHDHGVRPVRTMADAWAARADDPAPGLLFEDRTWSWAEVVDAARRRAGAWARLRQEGPPHVAVLLDNVPEHVWWLGACAMSGAVVVGANPTHPGPALAEELAYTRCQVLVTDTAHLALVEGLDLGPGIGRAEPTNPRVVLVDGDPGGDLDSAALPASDAADPTSLGYLIFTSGTSGRPKACRCTQGRMLFAGSALAQRYGFDSSTRCYVAMPLFHSNALMAGWAPAVAGGAAMVLPSGGRFSASGFLPDVRRHGVTYWNYVGRPLSYVLATEERPDDAETTLRDVFGNEAAAGDVERFARRFGCSVSENYGSTEGGVAVPRTPETPAGALGPAPAGSLVIGADGHECALAVFDENGVLRNAAEAIGELVSTTAPAMFEGYWENPDADGARVRDGRYWTGDLVYRDADGFLWFAGRADDWLRVDGENFAAAPVARILERHPDVVMAAVYAVPDPTVGDQVMAALQLRPGARFDGASFGAFLTEQADLGRKWVPRFVRVSQSLPTTATAKILVRQLRGEGLDCADEVFERADGVALSFAPRPPGRTPPTGTHRLG